MTSIRYAILFCLLLSGSYTSYCQEKNIKTPVISTTIDFLDYVFYYNYPNRSTQTYFPLEEWEKCMAEIAASGIKKVYLRVNVAGLTLYPTNVGTQYGNQGGWHWTDPDQAQWLINTLKKYDPVKETVRLGEKYKMEVWCWENLWDDAATIYEPQAKKYPDMVKKYGCYPLMDPFFRKNPGYYWEMDPRLAKKVNSINQSVPGKIIRKIVFISAPTGGVCRITRDNTSIYTSDDNITYTKYSNDFTLTSVRNNGVNTLTIDNLNLTGRFVKLMNEQDWPTNSYTMVLDRVRGKSQAFDANGNEIYTVWTWQQDKVNPLTNFLAFTQGVPAAWDYGSRCVGFMTGETVPDTNFMGVCEFSIPEAKAYKLAKFGELASNYQFDGFMFNLRTHSRAKLDAENYGYNQVIREKYLQRYGKDIYAEDFDKAKWQNLKAESVDEFLRDAKKLTGGRPLYISGLKNRDPADTIRSPYELFGNLPWHYQQWFADGSIDGVIMLGEYFPEYFTSEITGGKPIKIGILREMGWGNHPPATFKTFMSEKYKSGIDEIELYETLSMSVKKEYYSIISSYIKTVVSGQQ